MSMPIIIVAYPKIHDVVLEALTSTRALLFTFYSILRTVTSDNVSPYFEHPTLLEFICYASNLHMHPLILLPFINHHSHRRKDS